MAFYHVGLADPTSAENVERAQRFAAMFMGDDPEAPNYDPRYKIIRSPIHGSTGPFLHANAEEVIAWLEGGKGDGYRYYGVRATLHPVVKDLEQDWEQTPARRDEIIKLFDDIVLNGDIPEYARCHGARDQCLSVYRGRAVQAVGAGVRGPVAGPDAPATAGSCPTTWGPTGKIGEQRGGQWWGGLYGWYHFGGFNVMFHSLTVAAECALLTQRRFRLPGAAALATRGAVASREDARRRAATRAAQARAAGLGGLSTRCGCRNWRTLYHASLSPEDHALIAQVRAGERERDWNEVPSEGEKNAGNTEFARFQYYDGRNPSWPEDILRAEYQLAVETLEAMRRDERDAAAIIADNRSPPHAVLTKGLTQVALGAPESVFCGRDPEFVSITHDRSRHRRCRIHRQRGRRAFDRAWARSGGARRPFAGASRGGSARSRVHGG